MPLQELLQQFDAESQGDRSVEQAAALYGKAFVAFKRKEYADSLQLIEQARTKAENAALDILEIEVLMAQTNFRKAYNFAKKPSSGWLVSRGWVGFSTQHPQPRAQEERLC